MMGGLRLKRYRVLCDLKRVLGSWEGGTVYQPGTGGFPSLRGDKVRSHFVSTGNKWKCFLPVELTPPEAIFLTSTALTRRFSQLLAGFALREARKF